MPGDPNELSTQQIYVASVKHGTARRLTAGYAPEWSPDGRRLVLTRRVEGKTGPNGEPAVEIAVISADGTGLRRLANGEGASWSPDGRQIALVTPDGYAAVTAPSCRRLPRLGRTDSTPLFSPDGRWLALSWRDDLYLVRVTGGRRRYVTSPRSGERVDVGRTCGRGNFRLEQPDIDPHICARLGRPGLLTHSEACSNTAPSRG